MSTTPSVVYLLSFDNGKQWEDYWASPLFLVSTRERADAIIKQCTDWIAMQRESLPPDPMGTQPEREITDEEYAAMSHARSHHILSLKPPYGITELLEVVEPNGVGSRGQVTVREISYLE